MKCNLTSKKIKPAIVFCSFDTAGMIRTLDKWDKFLNSLPDDKI